MSTDLINSLFPFIGCIFVMMNIKQLYKDKSVKGIFLLSPLFFYIGQAWNVYFMYDLQQYYSFIGGGLLTMFCFIWFGMAVYYKFINNI
jgi:predicted membrane protein